MRTKDKLMNFENMTILCQYLYMNEAHFITVDNGMAKIEVRMDKNYNFKAKNLNFPELPDLNWTDTMNIPNIISIVEQLKEVEPEIFKESYENRWEEIKNITLHNMTLNKAK